MELERWEIESAPLRREEEKATRRAAADARQSQSMPRKTQATNRAAIVRIFGGGEAGERAADKYFQDRGQPEMMRHPTPKPDSSQQTPASGATKPNQPKSR
jgi:hypothetical protein